MEQSLKVHLQSKPLVCDSRRIVRKKLDEEIQIAFGWIKSSRSDGPEQFQPPDVMLSADSVNLTTMLFDYGEHL